MDPTIARLAIAPFTIGPDPVLLGPVAPLRPWRAIAPRIDISRATAEHRVTISIVYSTDGGVTWQAFMHAEGVSPGRDKQGVLQTISEVHWWYQEAEPAQDPEGVLLGAFVSALMPVESDGGEVVVG